MVEKMELVKLGNTDIGFLSFFESEKDIPFAIKRIYYIYDVPKGIIRGFHAHKELRQFLFCVNGKIQITIDNGIRKEDIILNEPSKGLIIEKGFWRTMEFLEENSVLMVAASDYYEENDYIRDYDEFIKLVKEGYWK